uniref:Uncharacterized protein n=1 Tax=Rhizophora mucronata TaxID=61149 RepID=A0A2P2PJG2_RHIMU
MWKRNRLKQLSQRLINLLGSSSHQIALNYGLGSSSYLRITKML